MRFAVAIIACSLALASVARAQTPAASLGNPGWQRTNTGCYAWNSRPRAKETVTWAGACSNGHINGEGRLIWQSPEGTWDITGSYADGRIVKGRITLIDHNGRYDGGWGPNGHTGQGTIAWHSGDRYDGDWQNGLMNGQGTTAWHTGDRYEGAYVDAKRHGYGTFTWADGSVFQGEWRDDKRNGDGSKNWASGSRYQGQWQDDKPEGSGTLVLANGTTYSGYWHAGCYNDGDRRAAAETNLSNCP